MTNTPPLDGPEGVPDPFDRLDELIVSVDALRETLVRERRAHKRSTRVGAAALTVLFVGVVITLFIAVDNRRQNDQLEELFEAKAKADVAQCESTNDARATVRDGFFTFTDALAALPPVTPRTSEEQARFDARVTEFKSLLAAKFVTLTPRDCSRPALGLPDQD